MVLYTMIAVQPRYDCGSSTTVNLLGCEFETITSEQSGFTAVRPQYGTVHYPRYDCGNSTTANLLGCDFGMIII